MNFKVSQGQSRSVKVRLCFDGLVGHQKSSKNKINDEKHLTFAQFLGCGFGGGWFVGHDARPCGP
jgi:hypothetical protein